MKRSLIGAALASAATMACAPAAWAQAAPEEQNGGETGLREIIVTAQKSVSTVQKTPISISVVDGKGLAAMAQTTVLDALKDVPSVVIQGAAKGFNISIRGLGYDLPSGAAEASVSTNFDGVYNMRAEAGSLGFYDLDRIEVLRGPQSTLYGRNATAGVVNVISASPKVGVNEGDVSAGFGNYNLWRGEAAVNLALGDKFAVRAAATGITRDGYFSNGHDDQKAYGTRIKALFRPSDDFSLLAGYEGTWLKGKGPGAADISYFNAGQAWTTSDSSLGNQDYYGYKLWAQMDAHIGPGVLTVLPAYQHAQGNTSLFFGGHGTAGGDPQFNDQDSVEVRYASRPGAKIPWLMGAYYYDYNQLTQTVDDTTFSSHAAYVHTRGYSTAVFGQVTVPLLTGLRAVLGGRETWDRRHFGSGGFPTYVTLANTARGTFFDYKASLEYDVAPASMLYFTAASGFRPAGTNPNNGDNFRPERLHSYEIGAKNRFINNRLQVNASAYYYDYKDFQVSDFYFLASGPTMAVYNANETTYGAELDTQFMPGRNDTLNLSINYIHSRIDDDVILHPILFGPPVDFKGEPLPHSPTWQIKGGIRHRFDLGAKGELSPQIDARYISRQYVAPNNTADATQPAYAMVDAELLWRSANERYSLSAYVKNLSNKAVKTAYFVGFVTVASPRTYGMNFSAKF